MKHTYRWTLLALALLLMALAGCSSNDGAPATTLPSDGEVSAATRLIMGTLKLEDTDQALSATQAAELLPLWKGYLALSESDAAAAAELDSVVAQIRDGMTSEQLAIIDGLALTTGSAAEMITELGLTLTAEDGSTAPVPGSGAGGGGGSGMPGTGPGAGDVTSLSPEQIAELQAERQASGGNRGGAMLAAEIVAILQARAS